MAAVVRHRAERRREWSGVGSVVFRGERRWWQRANDGSAFVERTSLRPKRFRRFRFVPIATTGCHERFTLTVEPPTASLCIQAHGHERSRPVKVVAPATLASAAAKRSGNVFPRFAARRSIPAQAFALKKYRCGTPPVSKMSNNEDATASLGHSEELSVQHSPGATIPEFRQRPDDGAEVPPAVRGQNTGDVFPDDPARPQSASKPAKLDGQVATRILQAATSSGEGEGLAWSSSGQNVDWAAAFFDGREIAKVGNARVSMRQ
jgi:hypothetical protein